jgi:hypothetical protein
VPSSLATWDEILEEECFRRAGIKANEYCMARLPRVAGNQALAAFSELKRVMLEEKKYVNFGSMLTSIDYDTLKLKSDASLAPLVSSIMCTQAEGCLASRTFADVRFESMRDSSGSLLRGHLLSYM